VIAIGDLLLRQRADRHRALALAVNLRKAWAKSVDGIARVGNVHRCAAPDDGPDVLRITLRLAFDQAFDHSRCREHRTARPRIEQAKHFFSIERARLRNHMHAKPCNVRHHVQSGAMTHRRGVQQRITWRDRVDLAKIGMACGRKHTMGQHRALRSAGGARRVEEPCKIAGVAWPAFD